MIGNTIDILKEMDSSSILALINKLNLDGIFSDEDEGIYLVSPSMEKWCESCTDYLQRNGYNGGTLEVSGHFFPNHGAIYVIFDTTRHEHKSAREYMDKIVESSIANH